MKKSLLLACGLLTCATTFAQRTPTHPLDIKDAKYADLYQDFDAWAPGKQLKGVSKMDDEFFISRVKPRTRIKDGDYKVDETVDANRKMCLWVPLDEPTSTWKGLPRYCFEGDNFSLWSYVDIHGNWTAPWLRLSAGVSDVAHKNGVKVGCVMTIPETERVVLNPFTRNINSKVLYKLTEKGNDYRFKNAAKLVKLMKYYGIDGLGVNSEFYTTSSVMSHLIEFFEECHKEARKIGWEFQLHWYDGTNESGGKYFDGGLGDHNKNMFGKKGREVTDMMFANYNWDDETLAKSERKAAELDRSSYDYYAGFDIQGRGLKNGYWKDLLKRKISIGFWGAHSQSLIHQSATDNGTSDIAIQNTYLKKQELIFSGGHRNPAYRPAVPHSSSLANADLTKFHGLAAFLTAKSTINEVPFVTRFNLGNGLSFRNEGKVTFDHKWYNLGTQDFMPTWRWWITGKNDQVDASNYPSLIQADLTFDDAYFGGSCLSLHGKTDFSRVKLFKTLLPVDENHELSLIYKQTSGTQTHAKLFVALSNDLKTYKDIELPNATKEGEWATFTTKLSALGIANGDKIAMIGIVLENTPESYNLHVGELAVRNPAKKFEPVQPTIKEVDILRGRAKHFDFKIRYQSNEDTGETKTYNEDVDTWYYEILYQPQGEAEQVLTATPSWAAYVIDAPLVNGITNRQVRFGVRAVAPDGVTKSATSWTEFQSADYNDTNDNVVLDRPVIKANETFNVRFEDELHPNAKEWKVLQASTKSVVKTVNDAKAFDLTLVNEGLYDLIITDAKGKTTTIRGIIQVSPQSTGAAPQISDITANKETVEGGKEVTYSATTKEGNGRASRGLIIEDPKMLQIPAALQQGKNYSYALWFKADKFAHDKQGTNLINKNTVKDRWPHNNWGDLWVQIRPEVTDKFSNKVHPTNEVSFNTMGWTAHDNPNFSMISDGYSITPGVWNHLVVCHDEGNIQTMYLNGLRVAQVAFPDSKRREDMSDSRIQAYLPADIFIGGGGVYKSGFNGVIDEVQIWNKPLTQEEVLRAMKGFKQDEIPAGLMGYFTFETKEGESVFPNLGKGGAEHKAHLVVMANSGGEDTSHAGYQDMPANNSVVGNPGIEGSLDITTKYTWTLDGANNPTVEGKTATVTYSNVGKVGATLTLSNQWGETSLTKANLVEVTSSTGINGVESGVEFAAYPNPFVESVNLRFAEGGTYTLNVLNASGVLVQSNQLTTAAGEVTNVSVTGAKGLYILQIVKDGKTYKTIKLVKK
ncbi:MAG: endo-beta-N-acetylglucosaminidase [Prevotella sp.]